MIVLGSQILADLYECDAATLADPAAIRVAMLEAARRCGATIVGDCIHHFTPHGVSGVVIIAESHLAIHTWPEHRYAALDLFTCGASIRPDECFAYLKEAFKSGHATTTTIARGHRPSASPVAR